MEQNFEQEIEDLRRRFGFEEKEAGAFWHLTQAKLLMIDFKRDDAHEAIQSSNARDQAGFALLNAHEMAKAEANVFSHFLALERELASRVLRRDYPEGWGRAEPFDEDE